MSRFIESICAIDGVCQHLALHQARVDRAFRAYHPDSTPWQLTKVVENLPFGRGREKLRIVYDNATIEHTITPYVPKPIGSLQIVPALIDYSFKFEDRAKLEVLYGLREQADDILILSNNEISDTYYANVALLRQGKWYTPNSCLLDGVKRQALLASGKLEEATIYLDDIEKYEAISLINAMLDLGEITMETKNIMY